MGYTVKKLAGIAGISVRTLHYYDELGILKPEYRNANGYRYYNEGSIIRLQQIMFFRELDFGLEEIREMISSPDFDALEALESHRTLLEKRRERIDELLATVDKTIKKLKGDTDMPIKEYYQGFSNEQIEKYRQEVRERWGDKTLEDSEARIINMGKEKFAALQEEGGAIFKAVSDNMPKGFDSAEVQELVSRWRDWLENFSHYSDEAVLGLGQAYSRHPDFVKFFSKYDKDMPEFFTRAIEYYCANRNI
jgi:DNA-binding transcriptional MerR regulator